MTAAGAPDGSPASSKAVDRARGTRSRRRLPNSGRGHVVQLPHLAGQEVEAVPEGWRQGSTVTTWISVCRSTWRALTVAAASLAPEAGVDRVGIGLQRLPALPQFLGCAGPPAARAGEGLGLAPWKDSSGGSPRALARSPMDREVALGTLGHAAGSVSDGTRSVARVPDRRGTALRRAPGAPPRARPRPGDDGWPAAWASPAPRTGVNSVPEASCRRRWPSRSARVPRHRRRGRRASGTAPSTIAPVVMRIGRRRSAAVSHRGLGQARSGAGALVGELSTIRMPCWRSGQ